MSEQPIVHFVLFDDGYWAGGFEKREDAEKCLQKNTRKKHNRVGQVVEGTWFDLTNERQSVGGNDAQT